MTNMEKNVHSSVLVVGGGIAGIQASLELADLGHKVYLLDESTSIGGSMAQLDKIFPINDCSICTLMDKLTQVSQHPNIKVLTNAEIEGLQGEAGDFEVTVLRRARYVDEEKCNGCGACVEKCPVEVPDEFNMGLSKRKSIYIKYPQAFPVTYAIDMNFCTKCEACVEVCEYGAINLNETEKRLTLKVSSIVLALGFSPFDPKLKTEYGYGRFPNVVNSLEFERILSDYGPYNGMLLRPYDQHIPRKIAFIQCVGSRDAQLGNIYCSSVCCMYAIKEAIAAKERDPTVQCTIFYMDIRTSGKDYELYYEQAKKKYGVRFVRSRVASVDEAPDTHNLLLKYVVDEEPRTEEFDLVVLSTGMCPPKNVERLAKILGINLNKYGFCMTRTFSPIETSKPGIFVCGAFARPKDIPETVTQASGVVIKTARINTSESCKQAPVQPQVERDLSQEEPRIGVFLCHCGVNISNVVNMNELAEYAGKLPNVVLVEHFLYACSRHSRSKIAEKIREQGLNRIVIGGCTPRTHEDLFSEVMQEAGLNVYLLEIANLREQCAWTHLEQSEKATEKAKSLVQLAVAKAKLLTPVLKPAVDVIPTALIVGGGLAGMTAALELANQGFEVHLVEKSGELGGHLRNIYYVFGEENPQEELKHIISKVSSSPNIHVYLNSKVVAISGHVGNFQTLLKHKDGAKEIRHGVVILATGALEYNPTEYLYGQSSKVITQRELEQKLAKGEFNAKSVVMIQCVGARTDDNPNCSRICCGHSVKNALKIKELSPETEVYVFYKDIRTFGFYEDYYRKASEKGVTFICYEDEHKPSVSLEHGELKVVAWEPVVKQWFSLQPDLVVLNAATIANTDNRNFAEMLGIPLTQDGFFLETKMELNHVDTPRAGVFICGLAHSPKFIEETITQAYAAAAHAAEILSKSRLEIEGTVAVINEDLCSGCRICENLCEYGAIKMREENERLVAYVVEALCKSCGVCGAACPTNAINLNYFTTEQILAQIKAALVE
jgi:heterodisulfide reductase subunit A